MRLPGVTRAVAPNGPLPLPTSSHPPSSCRSSRCSDYEAQLKYAEDEAATAGQAELESAVSKLMSEKVGRGSRGPRPSRLFSLLTFPPVHVSSRHFRHCFRMRWRPTSRRASSRWTSSSVPRGRRSSPKRRSSRPCGASWTSAFVVALSLRSCRPVFSFRPLFLPCPAPSASPLCPLLFSNAQLSLLLTRTQSKLTKADDERIKLQHILADQDEEHRRQVEEMEASSRATFNDALRELREELEAEVGRGTREAI